MCLGAGPGGVTGAERSAGHSAPRKRSVRRLTPGPRGGEMARWRAGWHGRSPGHALMPQAGHQLLGGAEQTPPPPSKPLSAPAGRLGAPPPCLACSPGWAGCSPEGEERGRGRDSSPRTPLTQAVAPAQNPGEQTAPVGPPGHSPCVGPTTSFSPGLSVLLSGSRTAPAASGQTCLPTPHPRPGFLATLPRETQPPLAQPLSPSGLQAQRSGPSES